MPTNVEETATPRDAEHATAVPDAENPAAPRDGEQAPGGNDWTGTEDAALLVAAEQVAVPMGTGVATVPVAAGRTGPPGARPASAAPRLLAGLAWVVLLLACWFCGGRPDLPDGGPARLPATGDAAAVGRPPARSPARPHPLTAPTTRTGAPAAPGATTEHD
ncbi:hypothetical protein ACFVT2_15170 [Streptomyces sp. NPDC058000]|uniref:hypothetical protein n=1 Tax=Streptomyces sp. NPDC058000 TaxID=3346299 RepID=UPI0036EB5DA6